MAGKKKKILTDDEIKQIKKLAAVLNLEQIADFFEISPNTLRNRWKEDPRILEAYKKGKSEAVAGVANSLLKQAAGGNLTAQIFYMKTQGGWRENNSVDVTTGGEPIKPVIVKVIHEVVDPKPIQD
jgi:hypothetical protein